MDCKRKILPLSIVVLAVLQVLLILFSWIITTIEPSSTFRSILSKEGIRWFCGSFVGNMSGPILIWLVLLFIAYGAFLKSGLNKAIRCMLCREKVTYRCRHALYTVLVMFCLFIFVVILLAFVPHAMLRGISGGLYPSAFSKALVPMLAFSVTVMSVFYGILSGVFKNVNDVFRSLYFGCFLLAPFIPVYILAVQLFYMVKFIFV